MNTREEIAEYVDGVLRFILDNRGRCFAGWDLRKIHAYLFWHFLNGTLFVVSQRTPPKAFGATDRIEIVAIAIAWLQNETAIRLLDSLGLPQFVWASLPDDGDSILVADVCGSRIMISEIVQQVMAHWPDSPRKKLFTYRREKLVKMSWKQVLRFAGHPNGWNNNGLFTFHS